MGTVKGSQYSEKAGMVSAAVIIAAVLALGAASYARNAVWSTPVSLWADITAKSPMKARAHYNYATSLSGSGKLDEAMEENLKAISLKPGYGKAHFNIGAILHTWGRVDEAIEKYRLALALKPDIAEARNNLGYAYYTKGMLDEALL
ncbi:MAG: tetratricopeptide repeat protein, partial [Deltaproteobacteria bacterium]|nr:tetratricopeptide repeat protein [Deltaproteobacteria bacterium]